MSTARLVLAPVAVLSHSFVCTTGPAYCRHCSHSSRPLCMLSMLVPRVLLSRAEEQCYHDRCGSVLDVRRSQDPEAQVRLCGHSYQHLTLLHQQVSYLPLCFRCVLTLHDSHCLLWWLKFFFLPFGNNARNTCQTSAPPNCVHPNLSTFE